MRRWVLVATISLHASAALARSAWSQAPGSVTTEEPGPIAAALRNSRELAAKISVTEKDRPLGELLPELGKPLGVKLSAAAEVADDKVTAFLKERPAAEVLSLIAEHFAFQWRKTRTGYELWQDLATRKREAELAAGARAQRMAALRAILERTAQICMLGEDERRKLGAQLRERLRPDLTNTERAAVEVEMSALLGAARFGHAAATTYRELPPAVRQALWSGEQVRLTTADGTISPETARRMVEWSTAEDHRGGTRTNAPALAADPPVRAVFGLRRERPWNYATGALRPPQWCVEFMLQLGGPSPAPSMGINATIRRERLDELVPPTAEPEPNDAALRTLVPLPTTDARSLAPFRRFLDALQRPYASTVKASEIAEAIHAKTGIEFIADSFVRGRMLVSTTGTPSAPRPAVQLLREYSKSSGYVWHKEANLVRLRSPDYPEYRLEEVPERVLRVYRTKIDRQGGLTLDDLAGIAAALPDAQLDSLSDCWDWYVDRPQAPVPDSAPEYHQVFGVRYHLRWWASLAPVERAALRRGEVLAVSRLTPAQRSAWLAAVHAPLAPPMSGMIPMTLPPFMRELDAGALAAAAFRLDVRDQAERVYERSSADGSGEITRQADVGGTLVRPAGEAPLKALGPAFKGQTYRFQYLVAGRERPLRQSELSVPWLPAGIVDLLQTPPSR
jgi:hypothetical protein